jgi:hypothetical protein
MTAKRLNLIALLVALALIAGWVGFIVYAEQPGAGEMAGDEEHAEHQQLLARPKTASNAQARLAVTITPQEGIEVGEAAGFSAAVTDPAGKPITNVLFNIALWHREDEKTIFETKGIGPDGTIAWQFAAHDGVPYEVRVTAAPSAQSSAQFGSLSVAPVVIFEPLAPPLRVKLLNTLYLVVVVGLGVAIGLWLAMRRRVGAVRAAPRQTVVGPSLA